MFPNTPGRFGIRALADPDSKTYSILNKLTLMVERNILVLLDWALILQSRYVYTVPQALKNAVFAWVAYPGSTLYTRVLDCMEGVPSGSAEG